jgi:hypothetical protein
VVCRPKHVKQLRNTAIINSTTQSHLVGSFYEIYITKHGSMDIKFSIYIYIYIYIYEELNTWKVIEILKFILKFLSCGLS